VESFPKGKIDWENGYFYGTGLGYPHQNKGSKARAMKVAQAQALSAILQVASGLRVDDRRVLADLEKERVVIQIRALIQYEPFEQEFVQKDTEPYYKVTYRAPMGGVTGLTQKLLPYLRSASPAREQPTESAFAEASDDEAPWLVLDARGLSRDSRAQPALFPRIITENGEVLFDLNTVDEAALARRGMARYVVTDTSREEIMAGLPQGSRDILWFLGPSQAMAEEKADRKRQGKYVVKDVTQVDGLMKTNLVISEADAKEIREEDASTQILKKCRVIVAVSSSLGGIEGGVSVPSRPLPVASMEPQKRLFRSYLLYACLSTALLTTLTAVAYSSRFLERADLFLYDLHFSWRGTQPTSGKTVLVLMDQKSALELERRKGSWSREHVARALGNLCEAGAEVIGLDMVLFAPGQEAKEDDALAEAMDQCGNVVLAKFVAEEGKSEVSALPRFQEAMLGEGFINMFPDRDGVLRKIPFFSARPSPDGLILSPSFSLEMVRAFLNLDFVLDFKKDHFRIGAPEGENIVLPYPELRIHFYGHTGAFQHLSFSDVVHNRFDQGLVKGRIVLIGSSLATDKDFFPIPFSDQEGTAEKYRDKFGEVLDKITRAKTVGVACHAQAIETMLDGRFIRTFPERYVLAMIVILGILGIGFYAPRPAAMGGLLILLMAGAGLIGVSHMVFLRRLLWVETVFPVAILALQYLSGMALQRAYSREKTKLVTGMFGKYVSKDVVTDILKGNIGLSLAGSSREVTVLFSDLRGFTTISEGLAPQETGLLLNTYFDAMIPIVFEHGGTLDKLMGDAIMAFFGAPGEVKDHPQQAAKTALLMIRRLAELKRRRTEKGIDELAVGIGLNTGVVTVGNLGSQHFMDYTVIGDAVNLGSRLEGLNKTYGTSIILSEFTARRLDNRFVLRELDRVRVKGKGEPVGIFELVGFRDEVSEEMLNLMETFQTGLGQYREREWERARGTFDRVLRGRGGDGPSAVYLQRISRLLADPPGIEWQPVATFTTK
jgi:adenylate cyclase